MVIEQIRDKGFCVQRECFTVEEIGAINAKIDAYIRQPHPGIAREAGTQLIRGIHGAHLYDYFFADLVTDPRLLGPAEAVLGEPCYVHQFKINTKQRMNGRAWPWHQDFIYWQRGDDLPTPRLLNVAILLGDVDMLQGPLCLIPQSHLQGDLSAPPGGSGDWQQDVSEDLTYQLGYDSIARLIHENGVEYITGRGGDVLMFDPLLAHCSSSNLSPLDRMLLLVTYNAISNVPTAGKGHARPEFLSARDYTPLHVRSSVDYLAPTPMRANEFTEVVS